MALPLEHKREKEVEAQVAAAKIYNRVRKNYERLVRTPGVQASRTFPRVLGLLSTLELHLVHSQ